MAKQSKFLFEAKIFYCEIFTLLASLILIYFKAYFTLLILIITAAFLKYFLEGLRIANLIFLFGIYLLNLPIFGLKIMGIIIIYLSEIYFPVYFTKLRKNS